MVSHVKITAIVMPGRRLTALTDSRIGRVRRLHTGPDMLHLRLAALSNC